MTTPVPTSFSSLKGNEMLRLYGIGSNGQPSGEDFLATTQQIAALANTEDTQLVNTAITTAGNGTLTAAGLVGGLITRTGPTAAYSDATDTAAAILAALPGVIVGSTFFIRIKNGTAFAQTLTAGSDVTLPANVNIPPFSVGNYYATVSSASAVTIGHISTVAILDAFNLSLASAVTVVSCSALTNVAAFSVPVLSCGTYSVLAELPVTADATGGVKLAIAAGNSMTATSFSMTGKFYTASAIAAVNTTTLGTGVGSTAAVVLAELEALVVVNAGGTINIQAAQNVSSVATTTLLANGFVSVSRIS